MGGAVRLAAGGVVMIPVEKAAEAIIASPCHLGTREDAFILADKVLFAVRHDDIAFKAWLSKAIARAKKDAEKNDPLHPHGPGYETGYLEALESVKRVIEEHGKDV